MRKFVVLRHRRYPNACSSNLASSNMRIESLESQVLARHKLYTTFGTIFEPILRFIIYGIWQHKGANKKN